MTRSSRWTSAGAPSAILRPKLSTSTRSLIRMTARMSCSTRRTVTPRSRIPRTMSIARLVSSGFMPAKGSSRSRTRGFAAIAIAIPRARKWPWGRLRAVSPATSPSPR